MNKKELEILFIISKALPIMTEFEKGYFLGVAESKANVKKDEEKNEEILCSVVWGGGGENGR